MERGYKIEYTSWYAESGVVRIIHSSETLCILFRFQVKGNILDVQNLCLICYIFKQRLFNENKFEYLIELKHNKTDLKSGAIPNTFFSNQKLAF